MICARKRYELLEEFKGKYFTHIKNAKLYKVTGLIFCTKDDRWKIKYKEVLIKTKCNPLVGEYKELATDNIMEFSRAPLTFKKRMIEITDKNQKFVLARIWDIHNGL